MLSKSFSFKHAITNFGTMDKTIYFDSNLIIPDDDHYYLRLVEGRILNMIPNIYNSGSFNNGLIRVDLDGTTIDIQLTNGVYTVANMTDAIAHTLYDNSMIAVDHLYDSPIVISANTVTNQIYITIDSTKSLGTQITIDLSQSLIYQVLGFSSTYTTTVDGVFTSSTTPNVDWDTSINLYLEIGGNFFNINNGKSSNLIYDIPINTTNTLINFPENGVKLPYMPLKSGSIGSFKIRFVGNEHEDTSLHFLECQCFILFEIVRL
jgi:hypothetical protein